MSRFLSFNVSLVTLLFNTLALGADLDCNSPQFALELQTRTSCYENNNSEACSTVNASRLFPKNPSDFIYFATLEQIPAGELNGLSPSSLNINLIHDAIRTYNHGLANHKGTISFAQMLNKTPKEFFKTAAAKNLASQLPKGSDSTISEAQIEQEVQRLSQGMKEYYQREVLSARATIYKELGLKIDDDISFQRIRAVEDFIRSWSQARSESRNSLKDFDPTKKPQVKAAFEKLVKKGLTQKTLDGVPSSGGSKNKVIKDSLTGKLRGSLGGRSQNIAMGAFEILDPGTIKMADLRRIQCPSGSFLLYDQLEGREVKSLLTEKDCRMIARGSDLTSLITEYLPTTNPDSALCKIVSQQLLFLRDFQDNQAYEDIEIPQNEDSASGR